MTDNNKWYEIKEIHQLDTPALVVFPARVKANIATAIAMTGGTDRLRPHVKTNKSPGACKLMMAAGIYKFKCATIAEAEMLGDCGAKDVLLAYQPTGPKLQRFISLIKKYPATQYSCITDTLDVAKEQARLFTQNGLSVPVYMDLNTGMNRTGIIPGKEAVELYTFLVHASGIHAAGLHAYDGHIRDKDIAVRTQRCNEAFMQVEQLKKELEEKGYAVPVVIAGGSPAFPIHAARKNAECSPGTFIYWDKGYSDGCPEQAFVPAAVLVTRVVSVLSQEKICTDLGHKSVAAENEIGKRIFFLNTEGLAPVSQSEEHLVLEKNSTAYYKTGDVLYGIPYHICPTVALYERTYTIEEGNITGEWNTVARDRKITI